MFSKDAEKFEKDIDQLKLELDFFDKEKSLTKILMYYYQDIENTNKRHLRLKENEYYNHIINSYQAGIIHEVHITENNFDLQAMNKRIFLNNYYSENENLDQAMNPYHMDGVNAMVMLLGSPLMILIIILIILIPVDMYFEELRKGCYKVIYSQPIKRSTYLFAKIWLNIMIVVLMLFMTFLVTYLFGRWMGGKGDWTLPMVVLNRFKDFSYSDQSLILISHGTYFIRGILMMALVTSLISLTVLLFSIWSDNLVSSCGVLLMTLGLSWILISPLGEGIPFTVYLPFKYLLVDSVLKGQAYSQYYIGLVSTGMAMVFITILMQVYFKRKDLLA